MEKKIKNDGVEGLDVDYEFKLEDYLIYIDYFVTRKELHTPILSN